MHECSTFICLLQAFIWKTATGIWHEMRIRRLFVSYSKKYKLKTYKHINSTPTSIDPSVHTNRRKMSDIERLTVEKIDRQTVWKEQIRDTLRYEFLANIQTNTYRLQSRICTVNIHEYATDCCNWKKKRTKRRRKRMRKVRNIKSVPHL